MCTMLDQRRRRWGDVALMLYKCFVFAIQLLIEEEIAVLTKKNVCGATYYFHSSLQLIRVIIIISRHFKKYHLL